MPLLTIKTDEYGIGLYCDGKPWRYFKAGDDVASLLACAVPEFDAAQLAGGLSDDDRERDFC